ncbi:MAG: ABC transporter ATP-binding protein [Deltaproteobacteria bacterium]|nr:ABC transporter ATP-binding protein [Deltaproteobacteria bacterium]
MSEPILEIEGLQIGGPEKESLAVDGLSLSIHAGETHALVGESGCGKTMTALAILGLLPRGFRTRGGSIKLLGEEITALPPARLRALRGSVMSMIFQEPMTALNPVLTVGRQISEVIVAKKILPPKEARERAVELMGQVGLPRPATLYRAYPHEFSGGMRQRVALCVALAASPRLIVADEPTTALDATVQAQILELLREIQTRTGAAILLITHNLLAAGFLADSLSVLYVGSLLERGPAAQVLAEPLHPYTQGLLASQPLLEIGAGALLKAPARLQAIAGQVPRYQDKPPGCLFYDRCGVSRAQCARERPPLAPFGASRYAACPYASPTLWRQTHA